MSSPIAAISIIAIAVMLTVLSYRSNPSGVERTYNAADKLRWAGGILFIAVAARTLIYSDNYLYYFIAAVGFAFLVAWILVDKPHKDVI